MQLKTKKCSRCGKVKSIDKFYKNLNICKGCIAENHKEYYENNIERIKAQKKEYRKNNMERLKEFRRKRYIKNPKKFIKRSIEYYKKNLEKRKEHCGEYRRNNREKINKYQREYRINNPEYYKEWYKKNLGEIRKSKKKWLKNNLGYYKKWCKDNPEKVRQYIKKRYANPKIRLSSNIARMIRLSLDNGKNGYRWEKLLGYNLNDLMEHLKNQFKENMSWNNYGKNGWTIDHIIPVSLWQFDSYDDREFKQCWALANLQPLWAEENLRKSAKVEL